MRTHQARAPDHNREKGSIMATDDVTAVPAVRSDFYVYVLFRENGAPFYVGYGSGRRWLVHEIAARAGEDNHRARIIRKMQRHGIAIPKMKLHEGLTRTTAKDYEIALIAAIGREPFGPLINLTAGGDGGRDPAPSTRAKMGAAKRGRKLTAAHRAKVGAANRGQKRSLETRAKLAAVHLGKPKSPAHCVKIGASKRGREQSAAAIAKRVAKLRGQKRSPEFRAQMSALNLGRKHTPEAVANNAAGQRGKTLSPETRAKISAAHLGKPKSPEAIAKSAASRRGRPKSSAHRAKISATLKGRRRSRDAVAKGLATRARNRVIRRAAILAICGLITRTGGPRRRSRRG